MSNKPKDPKSMSRVDLTASVDPSTMRYIRQLTGKESAFPMPTEKISSDLTERQDKFIRHYTSSGGITKEALKASGASRDELDQWLLDEKFKKAYRHAQSDWVEELRKAAMLRATAKSDVLLIFLLKSLQPEVFDEDVRKQQFAGLAAQNKDAIPVRATLVRENVTIDFMEKAEELRDMIHSGKAIDITNEPEGRDAIGHSSPPDDALSIEVALHDKSVAIDPFAPKD